MSNSPGRSPLPPASPLVAVHELDGSWTIHGLGVRLSSAAIVTLAESILEHAQPNGAR